eukprot:SAG31_NODE_14843_length_785_cov_0.848397_1_plen_86_part_10
MLGPDLSAERRDGRVAAAAQAAVREQTVLPPRVRTEVRAGLDAAAARADWLRVGVLRVTCWVALVGPARHQHATAQTDPREHGVPV